MTTWLHEQRLAAVHGVLQRSGARSVLDLGCGEGDLLMRLVDEPQVERIVGVDRCSDALRCLRERIGPSSAEHGVSVELLHSTIAEAGRSLSGFDCAILVEVIEHMEPERLSGLERAVFAEMRPDTVVITTPNAEFNPLLGVPGHRFRHPDHRFEWDRSKFHRWARGVAGRHRYHVTLADIAGRHPEFGGASQMAIFAAFHEACRAA